MSERMGPTAYVPMLRDLADQLERDERDRAHRAMPTENKPHDSEIASIDLGWNALGWNTGDYRWSVRSQCGVVKVWSSRDGCMFAMNPDRAREIGRQFAIALDAAAEATDRASRGEPRRPTEPDESQGLDVDFAGRIERLVVHYFRDEVYRAPEARVEWRDDLIRDLQSVAADALNEGALLGVMGALPENAIVTIARCPEHGLHGQRDDCVVCAGPVDQVQMIEIKTRPAVEDDDA